MRTRGCVGGIPTPYGQDHRPGFESRQGQEILSSPDRPDWLFSPTLSYSTGTDFLSCAYSRWAFSSPLISTYCRGSELVEVYSAPLICRHGVDRHFAFYLPNRTWVKELQWSLKRRDSLFPFLLFVFSPLLEMLFVTDSNEQCFSWEAANLSGSQKLLCLL